MDDKSKKAGAQTKQVQGEGDYAAAQHYDDKTREFVKQHKAEIPGMAKDAEAALDGSEGDSLRQAEEAGKAKAKG